VISAACVILIFAFMTRVQSRYWQGEIPLFQRTLKFHPNFGRVRLLLAKAYYFKGDYPGAISEYQKALATMEGYLNKTKGTSAEGVYRFYAKEIHFELAHCYEQLGKFDEAMIQYKEAQQLDPRDVDIDNNLGIDYLYLQKNGEARACFQKVLQSKPNHIMALNNLAFCYLKEKNFQEAEKILNKALAFDPASSLTQKNLTEVLKAKKESKIKRP
jgi:Flp pilus assembly protein TadD